MNVLVFNSGSSSLKYQLINTEKREVLVKGNVERIGEEVDYQTAVKMVFTAVGELKIDAVGHRVVHGGEHFKHATLVDDKTLKTVDSVSHLAPLHNPANVMGIKACRSLMPKIPNVMVFDTAFHADMPQKAFMYAIPTSDYKQHGIRRYGFHGTSHDYVSAECARLYGKPREKLKIITVHIGNGASICAIDHGKSVETSMGLTPLEGLVMATRSGDIDPAAIEYIAKAHNFTIEQTVSYLNKKCGLAALCNIGTADFRLMLGEYNKGNTDVANAFDVSFHRIVKYIGAYVAVMNGVDAIAFTGGIGTNIPLMRSRVMQQFDYIGAAIDEKKNAFHFCNSQTGEISAKGSRVRTFAICTNEELSIALQTLDIVKKV